MAYEEGTTIAVKKHTVAMLKELKQEWHTQSFDETIQKLITKTKKPKKSMFGSLKGNWPEFVREEIDRIN